MPYRRLPNTDKARIAALEKAVEMEYKYSKFELAASYKTLNEARSFLNKFKTAYSRYHYSYGEQIKYAGKYQSLVRTARLYVSHFIQVLNMAIIRNEIKKEHRVYYGLDINCTTVPDLLNEADLLSWGEKIIAGENRRVSQGGSPIYTPTIAKVAVHYDIFKEAYHCQQGFRQNASRSLALLSAMREEGDGIILDIWNQVETYFSSLPTEIRMDKCREYGIIYYYRTGEKKT
ncbi:MAG: hypothetical protein ACLSC9_03125 [Barnesiella sp.]